MAKRFVLLWPALLILCLSVVTVEAQPAAFTYQGKLTDNGMPANGKYDLQFALYDSASGGAQIGLTQVIPNVSTSEGVFTVTLDFGLSAFNGAARFLEISTRPSGGGAFTLLTPRQVITSTPYAVRSLSSATADTATNATNAANATNATNATNAATANNAQQLAGVAASQYVLTGDARLSDSRTPVAGSSNYIQNSTNQQTSSNFNISGNGTVGGTLSGNVLSAVTQYNLGGQRVLGANLSNQTTYLGLGAGSKQTSATENAFFGNSAGLNNTSGSFNSFFGNLTGTANTTGYGNSFFGVQAGKVNTTGTNNVFVGDQAGFANTTGSNNVALGDAAGFSNTAENYNTFIGAGSDGAAGITNATAIGANAVVTQSDSLVLGNNANVGIGTSEPWARLQVVSPRYGLRVQTDSPGGTVASFGGYGQFLIDAPGILGGRFSVWENGNVGIGWAFHQHKLEVIDQGNSGLRVQNESSGGTVASFGSRGDFNVDASGFAGGRFTVKENGRVGIATTSPAALLDVNGTIRYINSGGPGTTQLCQNTNGEISICSSSRRYKTDFHPFSSGLNLIDRLHPITFRWKTNQALDLGLGAEDVAAIEPLLVTRNDKGEVEGVKYDRLSAVFINAFKEQQDQIERLRKEMAQLKKQVGSSRRYRRVRRDQRSRSM